jgi:NADPH-dependent 2,4-dienoyl-CoA reductase/sulfur reductase-like enzyme
VSAAPPPVVVGAGPAGVRAIAALLRHGLKPVLIDESPRSGGQIYRRPAPPLQRAASILYGFDAARARALHRDFDALAPHLDYRPGMLVWNITEDAVHTADTASGRRERIARRDLILAPGAADRTLPLAGWTTPGVFTMGGAQVLLKAQACSIGRVVVFLGSGPLLYLVAWQYAKAGARVAAVLDVNPLRARLRALPWLAARPGMLARGLFYLAALRARGVPVLTGVEPLQVCGDGGVTGLRVRRGDKVLDFACDAIGYGYHLQAETQLADLAGCEFRLDAQTRQWLPRTDRDGRAAPGVYLAGDGVAVRGADVAEWSGELAALALLSDRGIAVDRQRVRRLRARIARAARFAEGLARAFPVPFHLLDGVADDVLLCRCEEITLGAMRAAARELGADEVNRAKAFARVGMGRCQGRVCAAAAASVLAVACGGDVSQVGRLRGQPPIKPIPILMDDAA